MARTLANYTNIEVPDLTDPQPQASGQIAGQVGGNDLAQALDDHDHSPGKGLPVAVPPPAPSNQGYFDGLLVTYASASTVDVGVGLARDSTGIADILVSAPLTADLTLSGVNGIDIGSESSDAWYALYAIGDTTATEPVASLLSLSFTAPILPPGYDIFRRVGAVRNGAGGNIELFIVRGTGRSRQVQWDDYLLFQILTGGNATGRTPVSAAIGVPPSAHRIQCGWQFTPAAGGNNARIFTTGATNFHGFFSTSTGAGTSLFGVELWGDDAQSLDYQVTAGGDSLFIWVTGYWDEL